MTSNPEWLYYTSAPTRKKPSREVRRRIKLTLLCNDGKIRRYLNGVDRDKTSSERAIPVACVECGWDFGFYDISDRTMVHLKNHVCKKEH